MLWSSWRTDEKIWRIRWATEAEKTVRNDLYWCWEGGFYVENWKLIRNKPWSIALWEVERRDFRQRKKNIYILYLWCQIPMDVNILKWENKCFYCFSSKCVLLHCPAAAAKSLLSCPTLCDPINGSPPGSPVPGSLKARTLEWVAISFSNAGRWKVKVKSLSCVRLFVTPWTAAYQAPLSMGFSRQDYWSGVPSPFPRKYND